MRSRASQPRLRPSSRASRSPRRMPATSRPRRPAFEPPEASPVPGFEPSFDANASEAESLEAESTDAEPQPFVDVEPAMAPRIEPWSPDSDPWGAAWTVPPVVEAAADGEPVAADEVARSRPSTNRLPMSRSPRNSSPRSRSPRSRLPRRTPLRRSAEETEVRAEEPVLAAAVDEDDTHEQAAEEQVAEEQVADESGVASEGSIEEPELGADIAVAASSTDEWRAPEPDVEPEPLTESDSRDDEPTIADAAIAAMVAGAAVEGAIDEEPAPAQDDSQDDGPTFADAAMAATAAALAGGATRQEPPSEAQSAGDAWDADAEPAVAADLEPPSSPSQPSRHRSGHRSQGPRRTMWSRPTWRSSPPMPKRSPNRSPPGRRTFGRSQSQTHSPHRPRSSPHSWRPDNPRTPTSTLPKTTTTVDSPRPPSPRRRSPPRSRRSKPDDPMSHGSIGQTRPRSIPRRGSRPHAQPRPPARIRAASSLAPGRFARRSVRPSPIWTTSSPRSRRRPRRPCRG